MGERPAAPHYWASAKRTLARRDSTLRRIIRAHPRVRLTSRGDAFQTLARSIVGQQISVKAADSVWRRLVAVAPAMTPDAILRARRARLAAAGLSQRKVEYIRDLAAHIAKGTIHPQRWPTMDDEAVIGELTAVRGIGRWTAEMFLIFNLLRPDVLPVDDLGLRRAVSLHYRDGEPIGAAELRAFGAAWAPWRSVATWYLWRSLDPVPVEY
ncbi:MAG: DNA-3-methyladenine glycosylase 2 family protein [Burkholderiales bacterium]|nr:DNA-3-methyladenine glycosylase 2 family protein [Burkholderiales bacterium]